MEFLGNHDITLDRDFYARSGASFHNKNLQNSEECISLLTASTTITYLCHSQATIKLTKSEGPRTAFKVFGSPYSPRVGLWAFDYARLGETTPFPPPGTVSPKNSESGTQVSLISSGPSAAQLWSSVSTDTDILVTHTPPYLHCDRSTAHNLDLGCEDLRRVLSKVRPRLHVCGHVHEARGAERVRWDTDGSSEGRGNHAEVGVERWVDPCPDGNKISLVDLTARGGKSPLDNDGSHHPAPVNSPSTAVGGDPETSISSDLLPLPSGLVGRRETCVVNAAIAATSWPHVNGKRFHKPIVVDLDLPVWT